MNRKGVFSPMGWLQADEGSRGLLVSARAWRWRERRKGDRLGLCMKKRMVQIERWHMCNGGVENRGASKRLSCSGLCVLPPHHVSTEGTTLSSAKSRLRLSPYPSRVPRASLPRQTGI